MKQIINLLSLRATQSYRILAEVGIILALIALFALAGVALNAVENMLNMKGIYSIPASIAIIFIIDSYRNDKAFLKKIFESRTSMFRYLSLEYCILLSPIIVFQLIIQNYLNGAIIIAFTLILSFVSTYIFKSALSGFKKSIGQMPLSLFELKFFIEERKLAALASLLLLYLGIVHISFWALGIVILLGMIPDVFVYKEPLEMIELSKDFLASKIITYIKTFGLIVVPSSCITWLSSGLSIWIFIYGISAILIAVFLSINLKYENYYGLRPRIASKTKTSIIILLMILPGFILITLVYAIMKYRQADKQIKTLCLS